MSEDAGMELRTFATLAIAARRSNPQVKYGVRSPKFIGLHMYSCTHWLRPRIPPSPRLWTHLRVRGRYWSAKIDDISLWPSNLTARLDLLHITVLCIQYVGWAYVRSGEGRVSWDLCRTIFLAPDTLWGGQASSTTGKSPSPPLPPGRQLQRRPCQPLPSLPSPQGYFQ